MRVITTLRNCKITAGNLALHAAVSSRQAFVIGVEVQLQTPDAAACTITCNERGERLSHWHIFGIRRSIHTM